MMLAVQELTFTFIVWLSFDYRYDDMYNLVLQYKDTKTGVTRSEQFNKSVANYFDETGLLLPDLVENDVSRLHNSILAEKKKEWA
jgi:Microsomal signal peptidase 25 kDa subunit (SPC25).